MSRPDVDLAVVLGALADALGPSHVSDSELDRIAYGHDTWPIALKQPASTIWRPDIIVWPGSVEDVVRIVQIAGATGLPVVPVGGLSGIVGGALAVRGGIVVDLLRMNRLLDLDQVSGLVRVEAGMIGANLEAALAHHGMALGHLPQSSRSSTVGGWIAHRAAGIASTKYGKIESILRGLRVVLADGRVLDTPIQPASAVGPMLHTLFLGVEGTLGVVVDATLAVHPAPPERRWTGWALPTTDGEDAGFLRTLEVVRRVMRRGYRPAIIRAYDASEGALILQRGDTDAGSMRPAVLIVGAEGEAPVVDAELAAVATEAQSLGALDLGPGLGEAWSRHRFDTTWLVSSVREPGSIGDALEIAALWAQLPDVYRAMRQAMLRAGGPGATVLGHLSHAYPDGGNLYMIFRSIGGTDDDAVGRYGTIVDAALGACLAAGGTVSHHHGIGLAKTKWLERELGPVGMSIIRAQKAALDPAGTFNPGKLGDVT